MVDLSSALKWKKALVTRVSRNDPDVRIRSSQIHLQKRINQNSDLKFNPALALIVFWTTDPWGIWSRSWTFRLEYELTQG